MNASLQEFRHAKKETGRQIVFLRVRFSEKEFYMTGLIIFPANNTAWVCFSLMKNTNG